MERHVTLENADEQGASSRNSRTFALLLLPSLAIVLNWPYLLAGFSGDDVIFLNILQQDPLPFSRWLGMWSIPASEWSFLDNIWWKDWTGAGSSGFFWRPIPSLVFEGFVGVFGDNPLPLHLLLIFIHACVGVVLYLLVRRITGQHWLALAAGVFFITCEDHSILLGWITAFTGPLAVLFTVLALLAHVHWLQRRKLRSLVGALLMLTLAMACKESASVAPLMLMLMTFFIPNGSSRDDGTMVPLVERLRYFAGVPLSWVPAVVILGLYLTAYRSMGLGTISSLLYVSPFADPIKYLSHLVLHLPIMWLGTLSPVSPFLLMFVPSLLWIAAVLGAVLLVIWVSGLWYFERRDLILWAALCYLAALLPEMAADASERGLYLAMVPGSILLAMVLLTIKPLAKRISSRSPVPCRRIRIVGWLSVWMILVPGIVLSLAMPWAYLPGFNGPEEEIRTALPHIAEHQPEHIIVLNTSGCMLTIYAYDIFNYVSERPMDVWVLSSANGVFSAEKAGDSSILIRTDRSGWLDNMFARITRTKSHLEPGSNYNTPVFTATLVRLTKSRRDVLEVRFDFDQPLDSGGYLFLRWNGQAFEPVDFAELSVGDTLELADTSDILKSMF